MIKNMDVMIYGTGKFGRRIFWNLMKRGENVICFIDSNRELYGGG